MNNRAKKINAIVALSTVLFSAIFFLLSHFAFASPKPVPEAERTLKEITYVYDEVTGESEMKEDSIVIGKNISAIDISDVTESGFITRANYIPDKFVSVDEYCADTQIIDLTEPFDFARTGTIYFAFLPPDPSDENYEKKKEILEKYKVGDDWVISVCLPQIFAASNIYAANSLDTTLGVIEKYDFSEHTVYYSFVSGEFSPETAVTTVNLRFSTRAQTYTDEYYSARIIAVHYQSKYGIAGMQSLPTVGLGSDLEQINRSSLFAIGVVVVFSLLLIAVYMVLSVSKRTSALLSDIVVITGILCAAIGRFAFSLGNHAPHFWTACLCAFPYIACFGALSGLGRRVKIKPLKYFSFALTAIGFVLAFVKPYMAFDVAKMFSVTEIVVKLAILLFSICFTVYEIVKANRVEALFFTPFILIALTQVCGLLESSSVPTYLTASFWLSFATLSVFLVKFTKNTADIEARNRNLTHNLQTEVKLQTEEMRAMVKERDDLIQFVSHDIRKTVYATATALDSAIARENNEEQIKLLKIVKHYNDVSLDNLTEAAGYAKFNYITEESVAADLFSVCKTVYDSCSFDCEANGIVLKNECASAVTAYVKTKGLENVIVNLIMNAIEHAQCKNITISVKEEKKSVKIIVADDGKGIEKDLDVFAPYTTEKGNENGGIGLFVCKNIIRSMGGTLTFSSDAGTAFEITLQKL